MRCSAGAFFRALFRRDFYRALFRGDFFCALFRRGFSRGLFCRGSFRALSWRGFFRALFRRGFFGALIQTRVLTHRIVWMNWYVRCLFFEFFLNYYESSRSILSKCKRKSTYLRLSQLKLKSSKKRPEAWHRIKSYQKRIIRFNQILLQFFLHNCLENQIPFKHMTNMSMIRIKRSLRYNVIYQPCFFHPSRITARWKRTETPLVSTKVTLVVGPEQHSNPVLLSSVSHTRNDSKGACVRPELFRFFSSNRFLKVSVD